MADAELDAWIAAFPACPVPFSLERRGLYRVGDLYDRYDAARPASWADCYDQRVYGWFYDAQNRTPRPLGLAEAIAARLHDARIEHAVADFVMAQEAKVVGFMGGHDIPRADPAFAHVAAMARTLRRRGFQIVTGGGPGLMEAANLGAFLAPFPDDELAAALGVLCESDTTAHAGEWMNSACSVRARLLGGDWRADAPAASRNLGIPTWLYGHEPPNLFATDIAKYLYNSVREDGLVTVASGGLVFAPGAAGTVQEIFQDANLNFYKPAGQRATPMAFFGRAFWDPAPGGAAGESALGHGAAKPAWPLVEAMAREAAPSTDFASNLLLSDDPDEIVAFIEDKARTPAPTLAEVRKEAVRSARGRGPAL